MQEVRIKSQRQRRNGLEKGTLGISRGTSSSQPKTVSKEEKKKYEKNAYEKLHEKLKTMERKAKGQKLKGCAKCTQDADGNMSTSDENFLGSEKYFEENGKERRVEEGKR